MSKTMMVFGLALLWNAGSTQAQDWRRAKAVLDSRCVTCHSCYTSPCQINLASYEGVRRGGSKTKVYDGTRLLDVKPSRLFIDAHETREWRQNHAFYPVIPEVGAKDSKLIDAVTLGKKRALGYRGQVFDAIEGLSCPTDKKEWDALATTPGRGMPFGFPPLSDPDMEVLNLWAKAGYPGKDPTHAEVWKNLSSQQKGEIATWEELLNAQDLKSRIVARYLYEHLFLAHVSFAEGDQRFFRLIRSRTPSPDAPDEIATIRPFDGPDVKRFHYRFVHIPSTLMHKDHIQYRLNGERLKFVKEKFLQGKWVKEPTNFPDYGQNGANPILTFKDMPARARYEFFLQQARYFVMAFIRGPVCEGQIALNVIQDQFPVFFLDPDFDLSVNDDKFLVEAAPLLTLPAAGASELEDAYYWRFKEAQLAYVKLRAKRYANTPFSLSSLWDGDGTDEDAVLTVFRHFDNAGVVHGVWGGAPKTVWVMDYPIFERMYYLLVAGFNVFGNVFHQGSTRMYMDNLRVESENNFLYLLPGDQRQRVRSSWYVGSYVLNKLELLNPLYTENHRTAIQALAKSKMPQKITTRYLDHILQDRVGKVNKGPYSGRALVKGATSGDALSRALLRLEAVRGGFTSHMPELSVLMITGQKEDEAKTLFLSKVISHTNVSFPLGESLRRSPEADRLAVVDDWIGSYPNFILHLDEKEVPAFVKDLLRARDQATTRRVLARYGETRDHPSFWSTFDLLNSRLKRRYPQEYAPLDLSKYESIY